MQWFNEPPQWSDQAGRIEVTSGPKSDFWRKTHYGFIRDNGHFYYQEVSGDFEVSVKITGAYNGLYDQAGLMLRVDEENWIKTGIEFFENLQHASAVVTRDFSDWSVTRLPSAPPSLWLRAARQNDAVNVYYSLDGIEFWLLRSAYLKPSETMMVGPMCASPDGEGFHATFEDFAIKSI